MQQCDMMSSSALPTLLVVSRVKSLFRRDLRGTEECYVKPYLKEIAFTNGI